MVLTDDYISGVEDVVQQDVNNQFTHGAIGTDGSSESSSDTGLGNELLRKARQEITEGLTSTTVSLFVASTEANGNDVQEVGFFDSSSGGEMQSRDVLSEPISKNDTKEFWFDVQVSWNVTQG